MFITARSWIFINSLDTFCGSSISIYTVLLPLNDTGGGNCLYIFRLYSVFSSMLLYSHISICILHREEIKMDFSSLNWGYRTVCQMELYWQWLFHHALYILSFHTFNIIRTLYCFISPHRFLCVMISSLPIWFIWTKLRGFCVASLWKTDRDSSSTSKVSFKGSAM